MIFNDFNQKRGTDYYLKELDNFKKLIHQSFPQFELEIFRETCYFVIFLFNYKQYMLGNNSENSFNEFCNLIYNTYKEIFTDMEEYNQSINQRQSLYSDVVNGLDIPIGFIFEP